MNKEAFDQGFMDKMAARGDQLGRLLRAPTARGVTGTTNASNMASFVRNNVRDVVPADMLPAGRRAGLPEILPGLPVGLRRTTGLGLPEQVFRTAPELLSSNVGRAVNNNYLVNAIRSLAGEVRPTLTKKTHPGVADILARIFKTR